MDPRYSLVLPNERHLKWPALDIVEQALMILCGVCLFGFTTAVFCDVVSREIGHPWLWLQEVTSTFFTYGVFIGTAVATRRADHLYLAALTQQMHGRLRFVAEIFIRLVILFAGGCMVWFGFINFLNGFGNFRMPSLTPLASYYAAIPFSGAFVVLFMIEELVNGWRNGFEASPPAPISGAAAERIAA
jgi:TRAP-type C4-dicarboxylate transport system permease small subunit